MKRRGLVLAAIAVAALTGFVAGQRFGDDVGEHGPSTGTHFVSATVETEPVPSEGDAADDPAIWIDRDRPDRSAVIGTDKLGGIAVYNLAGRELQYRPHGKINNVDLREGFPLGSRQVAIVAATNRSSNTVALYRVDPRTRKLVNVDLEVADPDFSVYGICLYRNPADGQFGFFVTSRHDGKVERWALSVASGGDLAAEQEGEFELGGTTEGCVVDDRTGTAYFAEEDIGIWSMPIEPGSENQRERVDSTGEEGHLAAEVEGLAIARFPNRPAQLIASSQGNDSFAVYRLEDEDEYLYSFEVVDGEVDGAEETDGIDVTTEGLGPKFPDGLLVVQDGHNDDGNQNFKLIPLCPEAVICPA